MPKQDLTNVCFVSVKIIIATNTELLLTYIREEKF